MDIIMIIKIFFSAEPSMTLWLNVFFSMYIFFLYACELDIFGFVVCSVFYGHTMFSSQTCLQLPALLNTSNNLWILFVSLKTSCLESLIILFQCHWLLSRPGAHLLPRYFSLHSSLCPPCVLFLLFAYLFIIYFYLLMFSFMCLYLCIYVYIFGFHALLFLILLLCLDEALSSSSFWRKSAWKVELWGSAHVTMSVFSSPARLTVVWLGIDSTVCWKSSITLKTLFHCLLATFLFWSSPMPF